MVSLQYNTSSSNEADYYKCPEYGRLMILLLMVAFEGGGCLPKAAGTIAGRVAIPSAAYWGGGG